MTQSATALSMVDRAGSPAPPIEGSKLQWRSVVGRPAVLIGIGVAAFTVVFVIDALKGFKPHPPHLSLLFAIPVSFQIHITAAVLALGIGLALMVGVKGRTFHKIAGWGWVGCMLTVAVSSFWIRDHGQFSYIHFLSGWVSISVPMAVAAVKRRDIKRHRTLMTNIFMGGLVIAGAFTFVPGRLMWRVFVG